MSVCVCVCVCVCDKVINNKANAVFDNFLLIRMFRHTALLICSPIPLSYISVSLLETHLKLFLYPVSSFCSEDYEPFDPLRVKKYVVDDEYTRPSAVSTILTGSCRLTCEFNW